jgi:hypothetical protein
MIGPLQRLAGQCQRRQGSRRRVTAAFERPRPSVHLELGPRIPCWVARLGIVAFGVAAVLLLRPAIFGVVVLAAVLVVVTIQTNAVTGAAFSGLLLVFWLLSPPAGWPAAGGLVAVGTAVWMTAGVLSGLGPRTQIELAALLPLLRRFVVVQIITQLLLAGALLLGSLQLTGPVVAVAALCCAAAIAVTGWLALPRLSGRD